METLAGRYLEHMAVRNLAPGTIKQHRFYLRRFFEFLDENDVDDVAGITREIVRDYQTHLYGHTNRRGEPNCAATQNNGLKVVKAFTRTNPSL